MDFDMNDHYVYNENDEHDEHDEDWEDEIYND